MLKYKCMHEYILPFLVLNFFLNEKKSFYAAIFKVLRIGILQIWTVNVP